MTINQVREQLQRLGDVVKVFPTSKPAGPGEVGGLSFVIVLLSAAPSKAVAEAAGVDEHEVQLLAEVAARPLPVVSPESELEAEEPIDPRAEEVHVPQRGVVRVDVSRLDDTVEGLSALLVTRFRLARSASISLRGA